MVTWNQATVANNASLFADSLNIRQGGQFPAQVLPCDGVCFLRTKFASTGRGLPLLNSACGKLDDWALGTHSVDIIVSDESNDTDQFKYYA